MQGVISGFNQLVKESGKTSVSIFNALIRKEQREREIERPREGERERETAIKRETTYCAHKSTYVP